MVNSVEVEEEANEQELKQMLLHSNRTGRVDVDVVSCTCIYTDVYKTRA